MARIKSTRNASDAVVRLILAAREIVAAEKELAVAGPAKRGRRPREGADLQANRRASR